jgi:hypothetical protein
VQSNTTTSGSTAGHGGYTVTVDSSNVANYSANQGGTAGSANGSHLFFTSKIALAFTTGTSSNGTTVSGSGSIKYILGS